MEEAVKVPEVVAAAIEEEKPALQVEEPKLVEEVKPVEPEPSAVVVGEKAE